jgi:hypothetical protein
LFAAYGFKRIHQNFAKLCAFCQAPNTRIA